MGKLQHNINFKLLCQCCLLYLRWNDLCPLWYTFASTISITTWFQPLLQFHHHFTTSVKLESTYISFMAIRYMEHTVVPGIFTSPNRKQILYSFYKYVLLRWDIILLRLHALNKKTPVCWMSRCYNLQFISEDAGLGQQISSFLSPALFQ